MLRVVGIAGTSAFIGGWAVLGTQVSGYSPVGDAVSEIARKGRSTHTAMTLAIAVFGVSTCAFAYGLKAASYSWVAALVHGASAIGVALTPLGTARGDAFHYVFAGVAYVSLTVMPWLASRSMATGRSWCVAAAVLTGSALLMSAFGPDTTTGLFQRLGFTTGDAWIICSALAIIRSSTKGRIASPDFRSGSNR